MTGYTANIEELTLANENFRRVLYTSKYMQLVVMSLLPGEEIGEEVHETVDQFFRIEGGMAKVVMDGEETILSAEMVAIVPAGTRHNVINIIRFMPHPTTLTGRSTKPKLTQNYMRPTIIISCLVIF